MTFSDEIQAVSGQYPILALEAAEFHAQSLYEYRMAWQVALSEYDEIRDRSPWSLAAISDRAWCETDARPGRLLGIAGPGAVGKDALERCLKAITPGMRKVTSSTTRAPRVGETEGVEYHFLSDQAFAAAARTDEFLLVQHREGRGHYGVSRKVLAATLAETRFASIQESPANLAALRTAIGDRHDVTFAVAYLLPPPPVFANLVMRFFTRTLADGSDKASEPVVTAMHSTLGLRQIAEFRSAISLWQNGERLRFLVNDNLDRMAGIVLDEFFSVNVRERHDA